MKKDHRRRLMVELGMMRSRRSRIVGITMTGRKTSRLANTANEESAQERPPLDESISIWLAEHSRLVEERERGDAAATTTTTTTAAAADEAQLRETIGHSPTQNSMHDIAAKQYEWEREGRGTIPLMDEGSAQSKMRRLRELREALRRSESSSMPAITEDEIILDDLTARYSSLEIKPLDEGSAEKENRRLRELREAFKRKVEHFERKYSSSPEYCASMPDDFVMRYDSLDTTVVLDKVGSAKKEARRLADLKETYLTRKKMFNSETESIGDDEPLRLDLLKRPTKEETSIEQKERMRIKEIQRLARLAAEKKVERVARRPSQQQQQELKQIAKERTRLLGSNARSDAFTTKKYKTKEERRLETLQLNFVKKERSDTATMLFQTPPNESGKIRSSDAAARTARQESILAEMKVILAEMDQHTKAHGQFSFQQASNQKEAGISADQQGNECEVDDEECWDITRSPNFYPREAQSLATTLPNTNCASRQDAMKEAGVLNQTASTTLLQAAPTQHRDLAMELHPTPLYLLDSKSLEKSTVGEIDLKKPEGESNSLPVPPIQQTVEDLSRVNSLDLELELVVESAILLRDKSQSTETSSLESIAIGPRIATDNRVDATEQYTKRSTTLNQQIQSNREENWDSHDFKPTSEHPLATTRIQPDVLLDVSSRFPKTRPFMAVHAGQQKRRLNERVNAKKLAVQNTANRFSKDRTSFLAFSPRKDLKTASTSKDLSYPNSTGALSPKRSPSPDASKGMTSSRFLDKPRPFQPNVDMVSSNTSGSRFKRTSDLDPEEKKMQRNFYDICTRPMPSMNEMAMTKISRILEVAPAANSETSMKPASININSGGGIQSGDEQVMEWLLIHLPDLQEDDAIFYFGSLLNDGFDCKESLSEVLAEDLQFMTIEHQEALIQSLHKANDVATQKQE